MFMKPEDFQKWRIKHGYTQLTLANVLSVSSNTIARWERGERQIPPFLHLALDALEYKEKEVKKKNKGTKKTNRRVIR